MGQENRMILHDCYAILEKGIKLVAVFRTSVNCELPAKEQNHMTAFFIRPFKLLNAGLDEKYIV